MKNIEKILQSSIEEDLKFLIPFVFHFCINPVQHKINKCRLIRHTFGFKLSKCLQLVNEIEQCPTFEGQNEAYWGYIHNNYGVPRYILEQLYTEVALEKVKRILNEK